MHECMNAVVPPTKPTWRTRLLARRAFVEALGTEPDRSVFATPPSGRFRFGLALVALSYVIAWPSMAVLSAISIHIGRPGWAIVGSTALYALSYIVFGLGMWCAGPGAKRTWKVVRHLGLRWVARRFLLR